MSAEISKWRATYTPGSWVVLGGPASLVVMQPAPPRASNTINGLWDALRQTDSLDALVSMFAQTRLDQMPSFATFFWHGGQMRSIVRGKVQVVDTATGRTVADGEGVQTWSEVGLGDLKQVRIDMEPVNQDESLQLPMATGVVLASAVYLDGTAAVTSVQSDGSTGAASAAAAPAAAAPAAPAAPAAEAASAERGQQETREPQRDEAAEPAEEAAAPGAAAQDDDSPLSEAEKQQLDQRMASIFGGAPQEQDSDVHRAHGQGGEDQDAGATQPDAAAGQQAGQPTSGPADSGMGTAAGGLAAAAGGVAAGGAAAAGLAGAGANAGAASGAAGAAGAAGAGDPFSFSDQGQPGQAPGGPAPGGQTPGGPVQGGQVQGGQVQGGQGQPNQAPGQVPGGQPTAASPFERPRPGAPADATGQPPQGFGQQSGFGQQAQAPGGFGAGAAAPASGPGSPQSQPSPFAPPTGGDGADQGDMIMAVECGQGHANAPQARGCRVCGSPVQGQPRLMRRPVLGVLRPTQGDAVEVDRTVLIGRSPTASRVAANDIPKLLTVPSPSHDISRTHLQVTVDGWDLVATDLNSTNGTALVRPETNARELLPAGEPVRVYPGCVLALGDGIEIRVDQA